MALTQMMQHYLSVKEKYKDCLVFYRLGDFYEMFFDDAVKASEMLDLTLTGKDCGLNERAPMCGVPFHAVDGYIEKLISKGEKVAICEQVENPATAKGMVAREVVRVVTPGTLTSDTGLVDKENNYICCAYKKDDTCALAWADITTGEFAVTKFQYDCTVMCVAHMIKIGVKEIICNAEMLLAVKDMREAARQLPPFSSFPEYAFGYVAAERVLLEQFKTQTLSAYSVADKPDAICAAGALVEYLKVTQMHALKNISDIKYIAYEKYMQLDNTAIKNLELIKTMSDGGKSGSLLWVLDKTLTNMGGRLLKSVILSPLYDKDKIDYRLDGVGELYEATVVRVAIRETLSEIADIERLAGKVSNGNITPRDCLALARSLAAMPSLKFRLSGFGSRILGDIADKLYDMDKVVELINNCIAPNAPVNMKEGGYIKQGFNQKLDELRTMKQRGAQFVLEMETRERDKTGIRTLRINFNRVFGYYIEVSKSFKDKVPIEYRRKQTISNGERYVTDELKELEEQILTSDTQASQLEAQIYEQLKSVLSDNIDNFKTIAAAVALLDVIACFAEVAKNNKYVRPDICGCGEPLVIKEGRHPVVELISKDKFIANDLLLDEDQNRTMILTGPNMAGKSTYMRQTALICIMAHLGSFVPAKSASIPLIDRVFTRVGASDNLISDQSTFMVEMIEVASIVRNATQNSLLILDEVGRGTSTYDGLSIAWAVTEYLTKHIGAKTMFATHYHELTELENQLEGIKNYKIAVREINGGIVFLRKIMRGGANKSFGIEVAALAGVPECVTGRAKQILKLIESGGLPQVKAEREESVEELSEVEKILSEVNVDSLSPMQAFMLVCDLVEKVKK